MGVHCVKEIFQRSLEGDIRYTYFLRDGDTKEFVEVQKSICMVLTQNYGNAIRRNEDDFEGIERDVRATYFHSGSSNRGPKPQLCLTGPVLEKNALRAVKRRNEEILQKYETDMVEFCRRKRTLQKGKLLEDDIAKEDDSPGSNPAYGAEI
ncbi:hypothetical protein HHI36_009232 [Cryptolaemus montrouzieri]|uniref:Uncharacterized protein n=1 Tax=Cryptolaemus montrouzieri TaxID=559131 RepID=A0ABD2MV77_9CUCU